MLPRAYRLKIPATWNRQPDFQIKTELFKLIGKTNPEGKNCKIGFIISGKIGKATVRNRVRRLLSGCFYAKIDKLNPKLELILITYPNIAKASNEEISSNVDKILPKIRF